MVPVPEDYRSSRALPEIKFRGSGAARRAVLAVVRPARPFWDGYRKNGNLGSYWRTHGAQAFSPGCTE